MAVIYSIKLLLMLVNIKQSVMKMVHCIKLLILEAVLKRQLVAQSQKIMGKKGTP